MAAFRPRRLAGCAAWLAPLCFVPQLHAFQREQLVVEEFGHLANWDVFASGAVWGPGSLRPGRVGDDGVLGDFVASDGAYLGMVGGLHSFQWSTDQQVIPGARTLTGQAITVTDGVFRFASFVVPPGVRVIFRGRQPLQLRVAGVALLAGTVDVSGDSTSDGWNGVLEGLVTRPRRGQPGAAGGPGAGSGGNGGDHPGLAGGAVDGRNGQDVVALPGHPYTASAFGTGGGGSLAHPAQGSAAAVQYCFASSTFSRQVASGGGGGSLFALQLGGAGSAQNVPTGCTAIILGPPSVGGTAFQLLPEVGTVSSRVQFLVGGAGGGGAGVNPSNSVRLQTIAWKPGGGGGGGGGAAVITAGFGLGLLPGAAILAQGGRAGNPLNIGYACPGGGGSGGSLLLQAPLYYQGGLLDLGGGLGGTWANPVPGDTRSTGGAGGAGYVRLESLVRPSVAELGTVQPPATPDNTGLLRDQDAASGARSLWFSTRGIVPTVARFRIDALEGGRRVVYSDDPLIGMAPVRGVTPIAFYLQGASVDPATRSAQPGTQTPWVDRAASLLPFGRDGLRFFVMLDRSILGPSVAIEVLRVEVRLRG